MTSFNDKEKAAENKYAHDKEVEFLIHARRNKLLGVWVAGKIGLSGSEAEEYAGALITVDWQHPGDEIVFEKVKNDLAAKGIAISEHDIRAEMYHLGQVAREQIIEGRKDQG